MRKDADRVRAKELFRQMSPKEKCAHIFRYYWMHMAAVIALVAVAVSIAASVRESIARENYLYIAMQEGYYSDLQPQVEAMAREANWPEELNFASFPSVMDQEASGSYQLVLYLTADQVDFVVCDEITAQILLEDELLDLTAVPLEETKLGQRVSFAQKLIVLTLNDTGRQEKVRQFAPVLVGSGE